MSLHARYCHAYRAPTSHRTTSMMLSLITRLPLTTRLRWTPRSRPRWYLARPLFAPDFKGENTEWPSLTILTDSADRSANQFLKSLTTADTADAWPSDVFPFAKLATLDSDALTHISGCARTPSVRLQPTGADPASSKAPSRQIFRPSKPIPSADTRSIDRDTLAVYSVLIANADVGAEAETPPSSSPVSMIGIMGRTISRRLTRSSIARFSRSRTPGF